MREQKRFYKKYYNLRKLRCPETSVISLLQSSLKIVSPNKKRKHEALKLVKIKIIRNYTQFNKNAKKA